jgi:spore photoproduct lyase
MNYCPERLLIEERVADTPLVERIRTALPGTPVQWVDRVGSPDTGEDGDVLEIVGFRGRFIKSCPGTRFYTCCGYQILHLGTQCSLGCSYCILQAYFPGSHLRIFANLAEMWRQLQDHLRSSRRRVHRIGTGEFTDSLLLDPLTRMSEDLVPFFTGQPRAVLELKTKTANVDLLENLEHGGRTIIAWSLNPPAMIASEEAGATSLGERLEAAHRCQGWGYRLAFHFDPLIVHTNWRENYAEVVDRLSASVNPAGIAWVSLGSLRFMPALRPIARRRHPQSTIFDEEFVPGLDGKLRYFRDLRVEMYRHLTGLLREMRRDLCIYCCMESEDVWRESLGFSPAEQGGLAAMLDRQALP